MSKHIEERRMTIDETLRLVDSELDESLLVPGKHSLSNEGKRLRPLICILTCELLGGELNDSIAAFTALELIHNATLVHDDILDEDEYRRGKKSTTSKYGVKTAVITGDALLSIGLRYAASTGNPKIVEWLSNTSLKMVTGIKKQIDINGRLASPEEFLDVNYLKSGSLFEAAGTLGAICAGKDSEIENMSRFGRLFGDAYQIDDDIKDTQSNGENGPRSDLENGDMTLPVIYALQSEKLSKEERQGLKNGKRNVANILKKSGAIETCTDLKDRYLNEASEILSKYPDSNAKKSLIELINEIRG